LQPADSNRQVANLPPRGEDHLQLQACDARAVRRAYRSLEQLAQQHFDAGSCTVEVRPLIPQAGCEFSLSSRTHPELGPFLQFGVVHPSVDGPREPFVVLPPLSMAMARELVGQVQQSLVMRPGGSPELEVGAGLVHFLSRFSRLVAEQCRIKEMHIEPLLVSADWAVALRVHALLHEPDVAEEQLPRPIAGRDSSQLLSGETGRE
jgi:acetyltransferase